MSDIKAQSLEEAAREYAGKDFSNKSSFEFHNQYTSFVDGAKWQANQSPVLSDEVLIGIIENHPGITMECTNYPNCKSDCKDNNTPCVNLMALVQKIKSTTKSKTMKKLLTTLAITLLICSCTLYDNIPKKTTAEKTKYPCPKCGFPKN